MRHSLVGLSLACLLSASLLAPDSLKQISLVELRDKIAGGWAGQIIGVSYGAPTEFRSNGRIFEGELPPWTPERLSNAIHQDDLYVDMTFARVLDEKGLDATTADFAAMFRESRYSLWHANLAARRGLRRGIPPGQSGMPRWNVHANDIDFQIEADFIGLMTPGMPQSASAIADRAGRVMNWGDGLYGGMFVSGMYSAAFFAKNPRMVVQAGLESIPAESPYGRLIADVLEWHKADPSDWKRAWRLIQEKWDKRDPCPEGVLRDFNIDAKLNGAYVALGLLFGAGDFEKTMEIATRSGQDSDCNPSSAAGILGVMLGLEGIPAVWKEGLPAIAGQKFDYTDYTFPEIVKSTEKRALVVIQRNGGRIEGDRVFIRLQPPRAPTLEVWDDYGAPVEMIRADDPRWTWKGAWTVEEPWPSQNAKVCARPGAEAEISFEGTGAIVVGPYLPDGGRYQVFLDGKLDRVLDAYSDDPQDGRSSESVWHGFGLESGRHTILVRVSGEPYGESKGARVGINGLVVFR